MRVITKKTIALLLSLMMVLMCIPASAFTVYADDSDFTVENGVITEYTGSDEELTIPSEIGNETITGIGEQAFINSDLTSVVIPSTVTNIDSQAFYYSYYLETVEFEGTVPDIGSEAFCYTAYSVNYICKTEYEANLKKALKESCECGSDCYDNWTINGKDFDNAGTGGSTETPVEAILTYTTAAVDGGVEITGVSGSFSKVDSAEITVTVPSEINGQKVVGIADPTGYNSGVFDNIFVGMYNGKLKEFTVVLPDGLKYIGNKAFGTNRGLVSVNLPASLERIGDEAFSLCSNLTGITLPEGLKTLGKGAFAKCTSLTSANIPASVSTPMPDSKTDFAFAMCSGITDFTVAADNEQYKSIDGVVYTKDGKTLVSYPLGNSRTSFDIPDGVETVANGAFALISGKTSPLNNISFPLTLKTVENRAFKDLTLESVTVGFGIEWGSYGFDLAKIRNITVAEGVTEIPEGFFNGVTGVESVSLPSTLKKIGYRAFDRFPMASIQLPEGLVEIGEEAFENSSLTSVTIPSTVTKIGDRAFYSCGELEKLNIAEGDTELDLGNYAFNWCGKLNNIELPARVKTLGDGVFSMCKSLTDITMTGVTKLGNSTFYGCDALTEMNMSDTIKEIGNATFMFCSSLKKVTLPANLAKWGSCTFECCSSLTEVTIPDTVTVDSVPEDTFYNCINLAELTLPKSIVRTEPCAFSKCEKLTKIIVKNTSGNFKRSAFDCYDFNGEGLDGTWVYNEDGSKSYKYDYDFTNDTDKILSAGGGCCGGAGKGTIDSKASAKPEWNYEQTAAGGTVTPDTDKKASVTVTDTKTETVKNEAGEEISKVTATVSEKVAEKLVDAAVSSKLDTVEITVKSDSANKADQVELELPKKAVESIAKNTDADLVIKTDNGNVVLDNKALETIAAETEGDTVKITVNENAQLKEEQKPAADAIGENGKIFDLAAIIGGKYIHDFKGGKAHVTLPVPEKLKGKDIAVIYINDKGICEILNHAVETVGADEYIRFTTSHFSTFAVVEKADAEKLIDKQNKDKVNNLIKEVNLKVKTAKTSKKSIKAVVSSDVKALTDAGYTVKYKFYRSTKKASKYTAVKTKDTNTYINTKGKKGTKYYYKAKVLVYDGDKLVGQTALTQCKYGVRTWSK